MCQKSDSCQITLVFPVLTVTYTDISYIYQESKSHLNVFSPCYLSLSVKFCHLLNNMNKQECLLYYHLASC
jgi:hypothetical protein